jgi:16S rRNA (guanine527-N7)-methyltransferase
VGGTANPQLIRVLTESQDQGFLGTGSVEQHIFHAAGFAAVLTHLGLATPRRVLDLGSGGGLPGLVLLDEWLEAEMALLDGSSRRCAFLGEAVATLKQDRRCQILEGRAEELAHREDLRAHFDLVVARSFGAPGVLAECAAGFLSAGGHLVVSEPPDRTVVERWPVEGLKELGFGEPIGVHEGSHYVAIPLLEICPSRYPRRVGVPTKRPLF